MKFVDILRFAVKKGASDVHLKVGSPPVLRIDGTLRSLKELKGYSPDDIEDVALQILGEGRQEKLDNLKEIDLSYGVSGLGRFRVNIFRQRGSTSIVLRIIPVKISTIEALHLPKVIEGLSLENRGLVLLTGTTGSGKSTTLAAMINHINTQKSCHVITIEDPIEFLQRDKNSIINQREVGDDTGGFADALRSALRQDPDVILVGEMRDLETIETAIMAAETGHLVMSTVHTLNATESINRIIQVFPPYQQSQIRTELAATLKAVISQRLVPRKDGKGRVPAVEVLVNTTRIKEYIEDPLRTKEIQDAIADGYISYGMQTFDQSLMFLIKEELITYEEAIKQCTNPDDFALRYSGISSGSDGKWDDFEKPSSQPKEKDFIERLDH